jgi:hypothetical protein
MSLRALFALDRIEIDPEGNVRYRLLRPWTTPTSTRTHLTFDPLAFLRRLAALIPSPYQNLVRYHGVFANRSKYRSTLPLPPTAQTPAQIQTTVDTDDQQDDPIIPEILPPSASKVRPRRMAWAQLLKRVLDIDALSCPKCKVLMLVIAFINDPTVIARILDHLKLPSTRPEVAPARQSDDDTFALFQQEADQFINQSPDTPQSKPKHSHNNRSRGPPIFHI